MNRLDLSPPSRPVHPPGAGADDGAPLSVIRPDEILRRQPTILARSARAISLAQVGSLSAALFGGYLTGFTIVVLLWHLI